MRQIREIQAGLTWWREVGFNRMIFFGLFFLMMSRVLLMLGLKWICTFMEFLVALDALVFFGMLQIYAERALELELRQAAAQNNPY